MWRFWFLVQDVALDVTSEGLGEVYRALFVPSTLNVYGHPVYRHDSLVYGRPYSGRRGIYLFPCPYLCHGPYPCHGRGLCLYPDPCLCRRRTSIWGAFGHCAWLATETVVSGEKVLPSYLDYPVNMTYPFEPC